LEAFKEVMKFLVAKLDYLDSRARWDIRTSVPKVWIKTQILQHEAVFSLIEKLLSEGLASGVLRSDINIKIVASLLTLSAESIIYGEAIISHGMNRLEALQSIIDVFFPGLLSEPRVNGSTT